MFSLDVIEQAVCNCVRCPELVRNRTQTVFGRGNRDARVFILGEAPGADEDKQGLPFVGRSGKLLMNILKACGLSDDDIYIANILKCRPPGNRNPLPTEAANCREYLDAQLHLVTPEFIVCFGAVAAQNLLGTNLAIGQLRGAWHQYNADSIPFRVLCTYHPSYCLRRGEPAKQAVWKDLQLLIEEMK